MQQPPQFKAPMIDTKAKSTQLDTIYNPQTQFIQSQIDLLPTYYNPQKEALKQAKVNAFRDIGNEAQSRGMFFSGFQPHEQARYLGEKYLPALAGYDIEMQKERQGLLGQIVGLNADRGQQMLGYYDKNDDRRYDAAQTNFGVNSDWWNTQQQWGRDDKIRAQDQQFQKDMIAYELQQQAKYAPRYSSGGGGYRSGGGGSSSSSLSAEDRNANIEAMFEAAKGGDGKVDPKDWAQIAGYAANNGLSFGGSSGFANKYWKYANDSHWENYLNGFEAYM